MVNRGAGVDVGTAGWFLMESRFFFSIDGVHRLSSCAEDAGRAPEMASLTQSRLGSFSDCTLMEAGLNRLKLTSPVPSIPKTGRGQNQTGEQRFICRFIYTTDASR